MPIDPLPYLCYYDPRHPTYAERNYGDEDTQQPRIDCSCDNCFYGRDGLALEIIRLREQLKDALPH